MQSSEIFRLSEDEAAIVQLYRLLSVESKATMLLIAQSQADSEVKRDNVYPFIQQKRA